MSDIAILVDQQDDPIGFKNRYELIPGNIIRITIIWIENSQGQVLLAKRSHLKKRDPNLWGTAAAGTVEQGETYESNAYKELSEEIGIKDAVLQFVAKKLFQHPSGEGRFISFYRAIIDKPAEAFALQVEEVDAVAWFDKPALFTELAANPAKFVPSAVLWQEVFGIDS